MELPGFVPAELRQLLRFVPLRGWDAVEWRSLLGSLQSVSLRYITGTGVRKLQRRLSPEVPDIQMVSTLRTVDRLEKLDDQSRQQAAGDQVLRLYFAQWRVDDGLFIDLRPARFGFDSQQRLLFSPNGIWIRLRPEFREGMLALYRSFYSDDEQAFESALRQMGMLRPGMSSESESELKALLRAHFGIDQRAQVFAIDRFKTSFDDLFAFFIDNDYKLHSDFVFVGFCLITLYLTLEQIGQSHDVRQICSDALL